MTKISNKQFILSSTPFDLSDFECHIISDCYLYTDLNLNVTVINRNESKLFLLGNAYDMRINESVESICQSDTFSVHEKTRYWTGRWVVITNSEIVNDATGLMPLYYRRDGGNWCVSSSLALMASLFNVDDCLISKHEGLDWQLLPYTIVENVRQVFPFQYLEYRKTSLACKIYNWAENYSYLSTGNKCEKLISLLTTGCQNIAKFSSGKVIQALTGGKDSRVVFGALLRSGIDFSTYTAVYSDISSSDMSIPKRLSEKYGISHEYIRPRQRNKKLLEDYDRFTLGNIKGADRLFYACEQFKAIPSGSIVIRSGLFEAGQTFARRIARSSMSDFGDDYGKYYPALVNDNYQYSSFELWKEYVKNNNLEWIDLRDRFYIDQRVCGWASSIEQSLDMNDFVSIQIANCAELLSILLSASSEEREKLSLTYETIKILDASLLDFPVNSVSIIDKVRRVKKALANPQTIKRLIHNIVKG